MEKYKNRKWTLALVLCVAVLVLSLCAGMFAYAADETGGEQTEPSEGATVQSVIALADENTYTLQDGFWREKTAPGYYAFTQGMSSTQAEDRITGVRVTYSDGFVKDIQKSELANCTLSGETLTVKLTADDTETYTAELNFQEVKPFALAVASEWTAPESGLKASTYISGTNLSQVFGFTDRDIGIFNTAGTFVSFVSAQNLITSDSLVPSAEYFMALQNSAAVPYSKTISVRHQQDTNLEPCRISISNISFDPPESITMSANDLADRPQQKARSDFDYTGFYLTFSYNTGLTTVNTPAVDFSSCLTITYANASGSTVAELTPQVNRVRFAGSIPVGEGKSVSVNTYPAWITISVVRAELPHPILDDFAPVYSEDGCSVVLSDIPTVLGDNEIVIRLNNGEPLTITDGRTCKVNFSQGGEYKLTISLEKGDAGDYVWESYEVDGLVSRTSYVFTYTVTVAGAPITLDFTYGDTREYGDENENYSLSGGVKDSANMHFTCGEGNRSSSTEKELPAEMDKTNATPSFRLVYSGDGITGISYTAPIQPGQYTVYAETAATGWYQAGKSATKSFEITKRAIYADNLSTTIDFDGEGHTLGSLVSDYRSDGTTRTFAYDDNAGTVLELPASTTYLHAATYKANIEITDTVHYKWSEGDEVTAEVSFTIKALTLSFDVVQNDFYYGQTLPSATIQNKSVNGTANESGFDKWVAINSTVTYYKVDGATKTPVDAAQSATWGAGDYEAVYTSARQSAYADSAYAGDFNLPGKTVPFKVNKAQITPVTFEDVTVDDNGYIGAYKTEGYTLSLKNYNGVYVVNGDTSVLANTVIGVTPAYDKINPNFTAGTVTFDETKATVLFTNAGTYTVTVSIDNANYEWTTGNSDDIVFTGKVYQNTQTLPVMPSFVTYNAQEQTITLLQYKDTASTTATKAWGLDGIATLSVDNGATDVNAVNGSFKVKNAGNYGITVALTDQGKNNYRWYYNGTDSTDDKTLTYTVNQAAFKATFTPPEGKDSFTWDFDETLTDGQLMPGVAVDFYLKDGDTALDTGKLSIKTFQVYLKSNNSLIDGNKITKADTYYIKVTEFEGEAAANYYLPTGDELVFISEEFTIESSGLEALALKDGNNAPSIVYDGNWHTFLEFITNAAAYKTGDVGNETLTRIVITVKQGETLLGGNNPQLRDVYLVGNTVTAYTVTIAPAGNYKWAEGQADRPDQVFEYTFTITQRPINIASWSNTDLTYNGEPQAPTPNIDNIADCDKGNVAFIVEKQTNAGEYYVSNDTGTLSGDRAFNYTQDGAEGETTKQYVIKKQIVSAPTVPNADSYVFNGGNQNITLNFDDMLNVAWFNGNTDCEATGENTVSAAMAAGTYGYAPATGIFTGFHAGSYTLTYTLNSGAKANYCFNSSAQQDFDETVTNGYTAAVSIAIKRATLTAPALGQERTIEYAASSKLYPASAFTPNTVVSNSGVTVYYTVQYGVFNKDGSDASAKYFGAADDLTSDSQQGAVYFAQLAFDATNGNNKGDLYDYEWIANSTDTYYVDAIKTNFGGEYGQAFFGENDVRMCLCYVITKQVLQISFEVNDYVFGANGYIFTDGSWVNSLANTTGITPTNYTTLLTMVKPADVSDEKFAADKKSFEESTPISITIKFYSDAAHTKEIGSDNLVNGLPWNADTYYAVITLTYYNSSSDAAVYENAAFPCEFQVSKRVITVAWEDKESNVYNGGNQTRTATITNMPQRTANGTDVAPAVITSSVKNVVWSGETPAAQTVTVQGIEWGINAKQNLTIDGMDSANKQSTLTITPAELTASGKPIGHTYGDPLDYNKTDNYTLNGLCGEDKPEEIIRVQIQDAHGTEITDTLQVLAGGEYYVVPALITADGNYTLTVSEKGKFNVERRAITITINTDADGNTRATSQYGKEPVNLNGSAYFTVGGKYLPSGVAASTVFTLFVTDINSKADVKPAINNKSIVGNYPIGVTLLDSANYSITNLNADNKLLDDGGAVVNYVITNADITDVTVDPYTGTYDAAAHPLFETGYDADRKNDEILTWYIQKRENNAAIDKNGAWEEYTNQTITNAFDSASYYVKVTADNHNPAYYMVGNTEAAVDVTVNKATLYVAVNKNIFFGEDGLQARGASEGKWWQQSLTYLRSESSIFTVTGFVGADNGQADRAKFYSDGDFYDVAELGNNGFVYKYFDKEYTKGANVGEYKLQFVANGLTCGNYDFASVADEQLGKLTVSKLPVTLTLKNYEALYNQENPEIPVIALSNLATTQTSSYGDGEIIAINDNTDVSKIVTLSHQALTNANSDITTNNADTYDITFTWNGNYNGTAYAQYTYTIKPTNNAISTEDYSLFMDAPSVNITKGETLSANAWIYGDYSSNHTDGYNSGNGGRHVLKEFAMVYSGEALTISLYREGVTEALKSVTSDEGFYATAQTLFNEVWTKGGFVAGDYTVTFSMGESQNYVAFSESWGFRIGKQTLTITPANLAVIYGYGLGDATHDNVFGKNTGYYYYSDSGLVSNGGTRDTLENVITFVFGSEYAAGYEKGSVNANGYQIHVYTVGNENVTCKNDGTYSCETDNYTVEFAAAKVTVSAREITVRIATLSNFFNLLTMDSNFHYGKEDPSQYLFTITTGTLADGDINGPQDGKWSNDAQKVFSLSSQALTRPEGTTWETNNAKDYPIYLLAKSNYSKNGYSNYAINVTAENAYNGDITVPSTTIGNGAYGTFTIKPAKLNLYVNGPYIGNTDTLYSNSATESANAIVYDGKVKVFKPAYELPAYMAGTIPKTKIVYYSVVNGEETECDEIKDVGSYSIICQIEDPNYETGRSKTTHNIGKRVISVSELAITTESDAQVHPGNNGAYYFNGYNQTKPVNFERLVEGELIGLNCEVNSTNCTATVNGNSLTITARNAGNYTVTITLQDNGNFKASNYALDDIVGATKQFGLNILKAGLTVNVEKANIQYGTPLGANNNLPEQGFTLTYEMYYGTSNEGKDVLNTILGKEKDAGLFSEANVSYKLDYMVTSVVDSAFKVQPQNLRADNFVINYGTEGMLTVVQRQLTVKIYGYNDKADETHATSKYLGLNKDPLSEGWTLGDYVDLIEGNLVNDHGLDTLKITLSVKSKRNANNDMDVYFADSTPYDIIVGRASDTNANYAVKFVNAQGNEIDNDAPETMPKFNITKATVTVSPKDQTVIYGNALNATLLSVTAVTWNNVRELVEFNGFVNGETYDGIVSQKALDLDNRFKFGNDYTPYGSHVGNDVKLWMDEDATSLLFTNYEVEFDQSEITVTPRPITVATKNQIYREAKDSDDNIIYNGGASGDRHVAPVLFAGHNGDVGYSDDYLPVVVDSYSTNATPSVPVSGAPTTVGNYFVTFTLKNNGAANCYDYVFANDLQGRESDTVAKLTYNVTPKYVNPYWEQGGMTLSGASATNKLPNYVEALMNVKEFTLTIGTNRSDVTDYVKSNDGLDVTVSADGIYTVTLTWLDSAKNNYRWTDDVAEISCVFYVSSNKVTINSVTIENWTYGESMSAIVASVTGGNESNLRYTYAYYGKDITVTIPASEYGGLSYNATPINAGLYVLKAEYPSTSTLAGDTYYTTFIIHKAKVQAPELKTEATFVFNGSEQSVEITFNKARMALSNYDVVRYETTNDGITVYATNAKVYTVTFNLLDEDNYTFANSTDNLVSWTIDRYGKTTVIIDEISKVTYGSALVINANETFLGELRYYYLTSDETPSENADWSTDRPINVGTHWVKAVSESNGNYDGNFAIASYEIVPARLVVTPTGSMTYGDNIDEAKATFKYDITGGLVANDSKSVLKTIDGIDVEFAVEGNPSKYNATNYVLKLVETDGAVKGLVAENYIVVSGAGTLRVDKKALTLTIGYASSEYGAEIDLSNVNMSFSEDPVEGDNLDITLSTDAMPNGVTPKPVGGYRITASYNNGNYDIRIVTGTYSITQRRISIAFEDGIGGVYQNVKPVTLDNCPITVLAGDIADIREYCANAGIDIALVVTYNGVANDGTNVNSTTAPQFAGTYVANIKCNNANFTVVGDAFAQFTIAKKSVDASKLVIENAAYTNSNIKPVVTVPTDAAAQEMFYYSDNGQTKLVFTQDEQVFKTVGPHTFCLTLVDPDNYQWVSVTTAEREMTFRIVKAQNSLVVEGGENKPIIIADWTFGQTANAPAATIKYGDSANIVFEYSTSENGGYTYNVPTNAGTYYVRATMAADDNYEAFTSAPVQFTINKAPLTAPSLTLVAEGEGQNNVYTGKRLLSTVVGYDSLLMRPFYDAEKVTVNAIGNSVTVVATNAGEYTVTFQLADADNYCWASGVSEVVLNWTIARQKVELPTANNNTYIVNGKDLVYTPNGFDSSIMNIEGNVTAYGGNFTATVTLKDTANYEWADDPNRVDVKFTWSVIGINVVFIIIICVVSGACVALAIMAAVQAIRHRGKKRAEARAIDRRSKADGWTGKEPQAEAEAATQDEQKQTETDSKEGGNE